MPSGTKTFQPANGRSHDAWVQDRKTKLARAKSISVQLDNLTVQRLDDQRWKVRFQQRYRSATYADHVTKELVLVKTNDHYRIAEERTTSQ